MILPKNNNNQGGISRAACQLSQLKVQLSGYRIAGYRIVKNGPDSRITG